MKFNIVNVTLIGGSEPASLISPEALRREWWSWKHRKERIRLSISALVRIRVDDQYLLVSGNRVKKYQPVGGVLKFYSGAFVALESFGMDADPLFAADTLNRDDLRISIRGNAFASFLKWYEGGQDREQGPGREFDEELIKTGVLDGEIFRQPQFKFLRRHSTGIRPCKHLAMHECLIAEIYELLPTEKQRDFLQRTMLSPDNRYCWADSNLIRQRGVAAKQQTQETISNHAEWVLPL